MDTVHALAAQSSDAMRAEIDCTRSNLADKLEALEDSVMGTVQSAQETVEDSIQIAKDTVATVKHTFDIRHHVEQYPWAMVGGCLLAGLALGTLFWRPRQTPDREQRGNGSFATAAPLPQSPPPSRPGLFDLFHDEIATVKGMAIGYILGLARDAIKDAVPQWAPQIDGVMNCVTTKLGGEPAQQHST